MSQAAALLAQGFTQILAELGEAVTFRGNEITAIVSSREPEYDLEAGGWSSTQTFVIDIPVAVVPTSPLPREKIIVRGMPLVVRTVTTPPKFRPAWSILVSTP